MALPGYSSLVSVSTSFAGTYSVMDGIKSFQIGDSRDLLDITAFNDQTARARLAALRDVKVTLSGDFEPSDTAYLKTLAAYQAGDTMVLEVLTSAVATTSGFRYLMKTESLDISGAVDGKVELSLSLMLDGSSGSSTFVL